MASQWRSDADEKCMLPEEKIKGISNKWKYSINIYGCIEIILFDTYYELRTDSFKTFVTRLLQYRSIY